MSPTRHAPTHSAPARRAPAILALVIALPLAFTLPLSLRAAPLDVVTDTPVMHSLTSLVMQDSGNTPALLLDDGADPHDFQLRPTDARALGRAQVVIWTGPGLLPQLSDAMTGLAGDAVKVALLQQDGAEPLDPHAWLDPLVGADWVTRIAEVLAQADPDAAQTYRDNAVRAGQALNDLTRELTDRLAPLAQTALMVQHDAYGPFARRFGLNVAGALQNAAAGAPSAAHLSQIRARIAKGDVRCILREPQESMALSRTAAEGYDVAFGTIDTEGSGLEQGPGLYADLLRGIASSILDCAG